MNKDYMNVDKEIIKKSINKKSCQKVKQFYINKINTLRKMTIEVMNNINNNQDVANKIYLDHFNKLQQIDFLIETLEQELINIKNETENIIKDN